MMKKTLILFALGAAMTAAGAQAQTTGTSTGMGAQTDTTHSMRSGSTGQRMSNGRTNGQAGYGSTTNGRNGTMMRGQNGMSDSRNTDRMNGMNGMNNTNGMAGTDRMNGRSGYQGSTNGRMGRTGRSSMDGRYDHAMNGHTRSAHVRRCEQRYHTYDASTDMFYARPGVKERCKL